VFIAWWFTGRAPGNDTPASAPNESAAQEFGPEISVEQPAAPPARDSGREADIAPAPPAAAAEPAAEEQPAMAAAPASEATASEATPENIPEVVPDNTAQPPAAPVTVPVHFMSSDPQVQFEVRSPIDSIPPVTSKAGDVIAIAPGTYRVVASGAQLETLEQDVTFDNQRPAEYTVTLCAERKYERENLAGQFIDERACAGTAECDSMFMVLNEHAEQLVKDRAFRTQQCAKWRANASPEGKWTLSTKCDGAALCQIEIAAGACAFAEPPRSTSGAECPRAELR
jgi:hypothetical protein